MSAMRRYAIQLSIQKEAYHRAGKAFISFNLANLHGTRATCIWLLVYSPLRHSALPTPILPLTVVHRLIA